MLSAAPSVNGAGSVARALVVIRALVRSKWASSLVDFAGIARRRVVWLRGWLRARRWGNIVAMVFAEAPAMDGAPPVASAFFVFIASVRAPVVLRLIDCALIRSRGHRAVGVALAPAPARARPVPGALTVVIEAPMWSSRIVHFIVVAVIDSIEQASEVMASSGQLACRASSGEQDK